jgi:hypothetical protein
VSYNDISKTMSIRIDREALDVLEWYAGLTGVPLRTTVREYLQEWAETISKEHPELRLPDGTMSTPETATAILDVEDKVMPPPEPVPPRQTFTEDLSERLGVDAAVLDKLIVEHADGTLSVSVNGVTFTNIGVVAEGATT